MFVNFAGSIFEDCARLSVGYAFSQWQSFSLLKEEN
jgi:hypothetical protein